jgi:EAL domain-containing protein (putative c-di-GMP-specific phosphodiesterase class I)
MDRDLRYVRINEALAKINGFTVRQHIGRSHRDLFPHGFEVVEAQYRHVLDTGEAILDVDVTGETPNRPGVQRTWNVDYFPIAGDDGSIAGIGVIAREVTEGRRKDLERRLVEAGMEQQLANRSQLVASLGRLRTGSSAEETAAMIAAEICDTTGIQIVSIYAFVPGVDGATAVALAIEPLRGAPIQAGERLPAKRARLLHDRALTGPWVEEWVDLPSTDPYIDAWRAVGQEIGAYIPLRSRDQLIGLLIAGTNDQPLEAWTRRLPTFVEYGAVASALLAPSIERLREDEDVVTAIARIIERREFRTVFHQIVELESGAVVGYEALTRFDDGTRPDLRFADAIAVGMGPELERATLEAAFEASGPLPAAAWLSINASPSVILDGSILPELLDGWAWQTVLEVTEHEPIYDYPEFRRAIEALGPRVRLSIDDAGAGFAGLRHILELNPQFVKLDIQLVRNVDRDPARQALIAGMAHFAAHADTTLIAEGIETTEERDMLLSLGVSFGQGFLFGRPAPASELAKPASLVAAPGQP